MTYQTVVAAFDTAAHAQAAVDVISAGRCATPGRSEMEMGGGRMMAMAPAWNLPYAVLI